MNRIYLCFISYKNIEFQMLKKGEFFYASNYYENLWGDYCEQIAEILIGAKSHPHVINYYHLTNHFGNLINANNNVYGMLLERYKNKNI